MSTYHDDAEHCNRCGADIAPHERRINEGSPHAYSEWLCEPCATGIGFEANGEAYAALKMTGCAIQLLRDAGVSDEKIVAAVHDILTAPHSDASYPVGGDMIALGNARISEQPWRRIFRETVA